MKINLELNPEEISYIYDSIQLKLDQDKKEGCQEPYGPEVEPQKLHDQFEEMVDDLLDRGILHYDTC